MSSGHISGLRHVFFKGSQAVDLPTAQRKFDRFSGSSQLNPEFLKQVFTTLIGKISSQPGSKYGSDAFLRLLASFIDQSDLARSAFSQLDLSIINQLPKPFFRELRPMSLCKFQIDHFNAISSHLDDMQIRAMLVLKSNQTISFFDRFDRPALMNLLDFYFKNPTNLPSTEVDTLAMAARVASPRVSIAWAAVLGDETDSEADRPSARTAKNLIIKPLKDYFKFGDSVNFDPHYLGNPMDPSDHGVVYPASPGCFEMVVVDHHNQCHSIPLKFVNECWVAKETGLGLDLQLTLSGFFMRAEGLQFSDCHLKPEFGLPQGLKFFHGEIPPKLLAEHVGSVVMTPPDGLSLVLCRASYDIVALPIAKNGDHWQVVSSGMRLEDELYFHDIARATVRSYDPNLVMDALTCIRSFDDMVLGIRDSLPQTRAGFHGQDLDALVALKKADKTSGERNFAQLSKLVTKILCHIDPSLSSVLSKLLSDKAYSKDATLRSYLFDYAILLLDTLKKDNGKDQCLEALKSWPKGANWACADGAKQELEAAIAEISDPQVRLMSRFLAGKAGSVDLSYIPEGNQIHIRGALQLAMGVSVEAMKLKDVNAYGTNMYLSVRDIKTVNRDFRIFLSDQLQHIYQMLHQDPLDATHLAPLSQNHVFRLMCSDPDPHGIIKFLSDQKILLDADEGTSFAHPLPVDVISRETRALGLGPEVSVVQLFQKSVCFDITAPDLSAQQRSKLEIELEEISTSLDEYRPLNSDEIKSCLEACKFTSSQLTVTERVVLQHLNQFGYEGVDPDRQALLEQRLKDELSHLPFVRFLEVLGQKQGSLFTSGLAANDADSFVFDYHDDFMCGEFKLNLHRLFTILNPLTLETLPTLGQYRSAIDCAILILENHPDSSKYLAMSLIILFNNKSKDKRFSFDDFRNLLSKRGFLDPLMESRVSYFEHLFDVRSLDQFDFTTACADNLQEALLEYNAPMRAFANQDPNFDQATLNGSFLFLNPDAKEYVFGLMSSDHRIEVMKFLFEMLSDEIDSDTTSFAKLWMCDPKFCQDLISFGLPTLNQVERDAFIEKAKTNFPKFPGRYF